MVDADVEVLSGESLDEWRRNRPNRVVMTSIPGSEDPDPGMRLDDDGIAYHVDDEEPSDTGWSTRLLEPRELVAHRQKELLDWMRENPALVMERARFLKERHALQFSHMTVEELGRSIAAACRTGCTQHRGEGIGREQQLLEQAVLRGRFAWVE